MRRLHFLGTMPQFADPESALTWQEAEVRDELRRWYGGETGARLRWFVPVVKALKVSPKIRAVRHGDWSGYDDVDRLAVRRGERLVRWLVADVMGRLVTRQVADAPEGSRFGVHLCLGDLGHRAVRQLRSAGPLVLLANAVARHWPAGRSLDFVHLPMSGGDRQPTTDPAFYAPLRGLRPGLPLVAGIAHEEQDLVDQVAVRRLVEDAVGGPVDIATSCGLGRRTPERALRVVDRMRALLH